MYIRRKVFSVAYDEATGEEKLFSTTEIMSEESYIEKLYAEAEAEDKKSHRGRNIAIGAGAAGAGVAGVGGGIYGAKKLGEHIVNKAVEDLVNDKINPDQYKKRGARGAALQKPADKIEEVSRNAAKKAGAAMDAAKSKLKDNETVKKILKKVARKG